MERDLNPGLLWGKHDRTQPRAQRGPARWHTRQPQPSSWWSLVGEQSSVHLLPQDGGGEGCTPAV